MINDFTKEELEKLRSSVIHLDHYDGIDSLCEKIKSMIDNCDKPTLHACDVSGITFELKSKCKHESDGFQHIMHDDGGNFMMDRCYKCGKFYK